MTLKARLANFTTLTRARTLPDPTDVGADVFGVVGDLYRSLPGAGRRIRLLGVQASGLAPAGARQLALLRGERWEDVERAMDRIDHRFGEGAAPTPRCSTARAARRRARARPAHRSRLPSFVGASL